MLETTVGNLTIHDLVNGNFTHIEDYLTIYKDLFPQYVRYIPVMRHRAKTVSIDTAVEIWHQWLLVWKGKPVGLVGFLYNKKRNLGLLMDFAIYPEARKIQIDQNTSFAQFVLENAMRQLREDAQKNGFDVPLCMAAEVEYAALVEKYKEYGYVEFPVEYFEPPTTPELDRVGDKIQSTIGTLYGKMYIGAFQIPGHSFNVGNLAIIREVLLAFLEDHYQLPLDHWLIKKVVPEIQE